jgi:hypothetical protein
MSTPEVINVKSAPYNATGNGVADDSAAVQAAFNAAMGVYTSPLAQYTQKSVYFPTGTYKLNSTILFCCNGVSIFGDGPTSSILKWGGATGGGVQHPILTSRGNGGMRYSVVRDLGFDGVSGTSTALTIGIDWDCETVGATTVTFQNLRFINCTTGIFCGRAQFGNDGQSDTGNFENCTFVDCYYGIRNGNFNALQGAITNCTFTNITGVGIEAGAVLYVGDSTFSGTWVAELNSGDTIVFENCTSSATTFAILNGGTGLVKNITHTGTQSLVGGVNPKAAADGCSVPNGVMSGGGAGYLVARNTTLGRDTVAVAESISLWDVPQGTFAQLPPNSPNVVPAKVGMEAIITDSNTAVWGATIGGGGTNTVRGRWNGAGWTKMIDELDTLMEDTVMTVAVTVTVNTVPTLFPAGTIAGNWHIDVALSATPTQILLQYAGALPSTTFQLTEGTSYAIRGFRLDASGNTLGAIATATFQVVDNRVTIATASNLTIAAS